MAQQFKVGSTGRVWEYGGFQLHFRGNDWELQNYNQLPNIGETAEVEFARRSPRGELVMTKVQLTRVQ